MSKPRDEFAEKVRRVTGIMHETMLISTILSYARSGHATINMVNAAIEMVNKHIDFVRESGDTSLLKPAKDLRAGLSQALIDGLQSLRGARDVPAEWTKVEIPLANLRTKMGHRVRRQVRCVSGIVDIYDLSADELIECKLKGTSAALGEAAGQLKRYSKSFPGASLAIAVLYVEDEGFWLADILRAQGISIIEVGAQ